jgi:hypothetical protein
MKLTSTIISLVALFSFASAIGVNITYDERFDHRANPLSTVVCSDVLLKINPQFTTFGSLPKFPLIGASESKDIGGPNSAACGSCWELTFDPAWLPIYVLAIDRAKDGFQLSLEAMNDLTNGHTTQYQTIQASGVTFNPQFGVVGSEERSSRS